MAKIYALSILILVSVISVNAQAPLSKDNSQNLKTASDSICLNPEITPAYPGGDGLFRVYLKRKYEYFRSGFNGVVVVKFLVEKDGTISTVEAIDGPKDLRKDAIKMVQKSGRWTPGVNDGKQVRAFKTISISFPFAD